MPFGDENKEKEFVRLFWENHKKRAFARWGASDPGGWANESDSYLKALSEGMNPDRFIMNGNVINYGQLPSSYAKYQDVIMPIFRAVGSPPATCGNNLDAVGDVPIINNVPIWPTQANVREENTIFGSLNNIESNIVSVPIPFTVTITNEKGIGTKQNYVKCHKLVAGHVKQIFEDIYKTYGMDRIEQLGMNKMGNAWRVRKTAKPGGGHTNTWSIHSWGIAFDFHPSGNGFGTGFPNATNSKKEWQKFWRIWENHGAQNLGRYSDTDWMHVQFARFSGTYPGPSGKKQDLL